MAQFPTVASKFQVETIVAPDGDEYHAYCPAHKGLHACGETADGALSNAHAAATTYIESFIKHGDPIPVGVLIDVPQTDRPSGYESEQQDI